MATERAKVIVLVKAAPVLTHHLDETMCVAGARMDEGGAEWIRLHPVPFRDLVSEARFTKYQELEVELFRSKTDRRPESWSPISGSIFPGRQIGTDKGWADRLDLVSKLGAVNMCDLVEANRSGSGPGTHSLAVVHPAKSPELLITERDPEQIAEWKRRADGAKNRISLFDDPTATKTDFEVVPWRFQYRYSCMSPGCNTHTQTIVDWEVVALWRRVRHRSNWQQLMREKFEQEMWHGRSTCLFVGNQEQHPTSFLVLGVFWPPSVGYQPRMF